MLHSTALAGIWRSKMLRGVVALSAGTAGAQLLGVALAPLITRLYGPTAFGVHGVFVSILTVCGTLAALAYPSAIALPRDDGEALQLVRVSVVLSLITAAIAAAVTAFWWYFRGAPLELPATVMFLLPAGIACLAWVQISEQVLIRTRNYGAVANATVANALVTNLARVAAGTVTPTATSLIVVTVLGSLAQAGALAQAARRRARSVIAADTSSSAGSLWRLASRHRDFPLYRAPQNFINAASRSLPVVLLASLFGAEAAGFYALATLAMGAPSMLVGKAVVDVMYPALAATLHERQPVRPQLVKSTVALGLIGLVPFAAIAATGPTVFALVFGSEWERAGEYAQWLALFYYFNFINKPVVAVAPVLRRQKGLLAYEVLSTSAKVLALWVGFQLFSGEIAAIALFSVVGALAYGLLIVWLMRCAAEADNELEAG